MFFSLNSNNTKKSDLNFFKSYKIFYIFSSFMILVSILSLILFGLNFGIDFKGGSLILCKTSNKIALSDFRKSLNNLDVGEISINNVSSITKNIQNEPQDFVLTFVKIEQKDKEEEIQNKSIAIVKNKLEKDFPGIIFLQTESVGAKVSGELIMSGIWSVIIALIGVLFYIWIRFEWQFAIGSILAILHDVLITLGIFSLFSLEFNLSIIAALLTIVGYSLNDTVIIYDRVRENLFKNKKSPLKDLLNISVNQTLRRTIITSLTTLLALLSLFLLGGEVIRGFSFAMIWGVIIGTYSSIFISSALLLTIGVKRDWEKPKDGAGTNFGNT